MVEIGIVIGHSTEYNRDRLTMTLMLKCRMSSDQDVQSVEYYGGFGDDSIPPIGSEVLVLQIGAAWKIAVTSRTDIVPVTGDPGDRVVRSTNADGSQERAKIVLKANGDIEIIPSSGTVHVAGGLSIDEGIDMGGTITGPNVFNGAASNAFVHGTGTYRDAEGRPLDPTTKSGVPE